MGKDNMRTMGILITLAVFMILPLAASASDMVTITGEVNDSYQIVDSSGQVYEIADTAEGNDLIDSHTGEKVSVTGTLQEDEDGKIIAVTSYKVITE
jgi:hypothetical protein